MDLQVTCPSGSWPVTKTYADLESFAQELTKLVHKPPTLAKFSAFEPLLFGTPDFKKASLAAGKFIDLACRVHNAELLAPIVEFFGYTEGSDCLNQMSKAREYKNKHGMTLTHYNMDSGLDLNYALFTRDSDKPGASSKTTCVLEGWKTAHNYLQKCAVPTKGGEIPTPASPKLEEKLSTQNSNPKPDPKEVSTRRYPQIVITEDPSEPKGESAEDSPSPTRSEEDKPADHLNVKHDAAFSAHTKDSCGVSIELLLDAEFSKPLHRPSSAGYVPRLETQDDHSTNLEALISPRAEKQDSDFSMSPIQAHHKIFDQEEIIRRDRESKRLQNTPVGIFHNKHMSKNIDCKVTCLATFSEADLVIAGLENGKIAAFKEVLDEETSEYSLELLAKVKVFKEGVSRICLSTSRGVLYCIGDKDTLAVVDMVSWKVVDKQSLGGTVYEFLYEEDYQVAIVSNGSNKIIMLDMADPKHLQKKEIKVLSDPNCSIRAMDIDSEGGLLFCSDYKTGSVSLLDIEFPFSFQSKVTVQSTVFGLAKCKMLSFWEKRKELYCGFANGIMSVHKLTGDSETWSLDFVTSCRAATADLHLINHFADCPFLFTSSTDGTLTLWSPPQNWKQPFLRPHDTTAVDERRPRIQST